MMFFMNEQNLTQLLQALQTGKAGLTETLERLRLFHGESLPSAQLDHHRSLRTGIPEAVFGENKTTDQLIEILSAQLKQSHVVLATRVAPDKATAIQKTVQGLKYHKTARMLSGNPHEIIPQENSRELVLVSAGTSDLPVAEEAEITLQCFGHKVQAIYDVGVAGIHRILTHQETLQRAPVIIVVAGMEGALPSVVAGITPAPVIGVPTSVGYGTGAGGFSALLGMLNSCAPGLAVVNIDNGFGAACMAAAIVRGRRDEQ